VYKIAFFVPEAHKETVKTAMFAVGAGKIGQYDCCSWEVLGEGQFRPLSGSTPFIGAEGELEKVSEFKVEMVCEDALLEVALRALKKAHPYEEPAYDVWPIMTQ